MSANLLSGLVAFYRNNGTDISGNGNHLSAVGSPTTTAGIGGAAGAAMKFPTGSDYFSGPQLITAAPFTLSIWVKLPGGSFDSEWDMIGQWADTSASWLGIFANAVETWYGTSGDGFGQAGEDTTLDDTLFHHYVMTFDGSFIELYTNNVEGTPVAGALGLGTGTKSFQMGPSNGPEVHMQFGGAWNRVLSDPEIALLYNGGAGAVPSAPTAAAPTNADLSLGISLGL